MAYSAAALVELEAATQPLEEGAVVAVAEGLADGWAGLIPPAEAAVAAQEMAAMEGGASARGQARRAILEVLGGGVAVKPETHGHVGKLELPAQQDPLAGEAASS